MGVCRIIHALKCDTPAEGAAMPGSVDMDAIAAELSACEGLR